MAFIYPRGPWSTGSGPHWSREVRDANNRGIAWCGFFPDSEARDLSKFITLLPVFYEAYEEMQSCGDDVSRYRVILERVRSACAEVEDASDE